MTTPVPLPFLTSLAPAAPVVYPPGDPARLRRDAVRHFVKTFFNDSTESAVVALLGPNGKSLTREELERLGVTIEQAKKGGRK